MIVKINVYFDVEGKWNPEQVRLIQSCIEMFFTEEVLALNGTKVSWKIPNSGFPDLKIIKGKILTKGQALQGVKSLMKPGSPNNSGTYLLD